MDARAYFQLTDRIAAAESREALERLFDVVQATEMHPMERRAIERVLRSRSDALRLGEVMVDRGPPQRAD